VRGPPRGSALCHRLLLRPTPVDEPSNQRCRSRLSRARERELDGVIFARRCGGEVEDDLP
jgi:hypothetical protein